MAARALPSIPSGRVGSAADAETHRMSMEKRAVLAAVLMALVFVLGQYLLFPSTPESPPGQKPGEPPAPQPTNQSKPSTAATPPPAAPSPRKEDQKSPAPPAPLRPAETPPHRLAAVETPLTPTAAH